MDKNLFLEISGTTDPRNIFSLSYELQELSTYKVGGKASFYAKIFDSEGLEKIANVISESSIPVLVVGNGSNLLIADSGFDGLVIQLGETFAQIEIEGEQVIAGGATSLPVLARRTVQAGLSGFEWAVGVPGSVGGAVRMNAGGHGASISNSLLSAEIFNIRTKEKRIATLPDLEMSYRSTSVLNDEVVLGACFKLCDGSREEGEEKNRTGTEINFKPSQETFSKCIFDYSTLEHRIRELAFLNSGVHIDLIDQRAREDKKVSFFYEGGLKAI